MMISGPVANNFSGAFQNPGWEIESVPAAKKIPKSMKGLPELPEGYVWEPCRVDPKPGAIFVPGKHKPYNTADYPNHLNFCHAMLPFIGKVTTVRASRGPDSSGKWTISIDADDGMFNYRWMNGWILKRDGVVVTKEGLPEGLELFSQTVKVGFPDTNLVGDRMDGCWEYFNGKSADLKEGDEFILGPYAILNKATTCTSNTTRTSTVPSSACRLPRRVNSLGRLRGSSKMAYASVLLPTGSGWTQSFLRRTQVGSTGALIRSSRRRTSRISQSSSAARSRS